MRSIVNPVEYAKKAAEEYRSFYGSDLVSVILYGSAAGGGFNPEKSDINLLIVLTSMDLKLICNSSDIQMKYLKKRFSKPLFMDKEYIESSCDSYPMEFINMKEQYLVLAGEDVLSSVSPKMEDLRLQVERELKGKWLHLIDEYTIAFKNRKELLQLAEISLKAFVPVFRALLKLKGRDIPSTKKDLLSTVESVYSIEGRPFMGMEEVCRSGDLTQLNMKFTEYSKAVKQLIDAIENN
ncbi:MAG TPA: nucleotidyltransferase domain-containing protein [Chitinispirillaceae bacterium]|nr:nucleotidyltransferase domain-containing protein [Chitinispirillaceae bacterium]